MVTNLLLLRLVLPAEWTSPSLALPTSHTLTPGVCCLLGDVEH